MSKNGNGKVRRDDEQEIDVLITPDGWRIVQPEDPDLPDLRGELLLLIQKGDEDSINEFFERHQIDGVIRQRKWRRQSRYKSYQ